MNTLQPLCNQRPIEACERRAFPPGIVRRELLLGRQGASIPGSIAEVLLMRIGQHIGWFCVFLSALAAGCSSSGDGRSGEEDLGEVASSVCSAVTVTSDDADYDAVPGQSVTWTGSPTCSGSPQYQFWFRNPQTGIWGLAQDWSSTSTYVWNTTGLPTGVWNMQLWVRDIPSGTFQAYTGRPFTLSSGAACTAVSSSISPSSGVAGTSVTFTNSASTCPGPEYEVFHLPPGGAWQLDSGYSTANSIYVWNTTGAATGFHQFQIWARQQGSTKSYQAYVGGSFTVLGASPCTSTSLSFSPATHSPVGTAVSLNAGAGGCGSPTFRYFLYPPGGPWTELQPYTSSPSATWNTTLAAPGTYNFQVWTRNSGSTQAFESYIGKSYTLDPSTTTGSLAIGGGYAQNCEILSTGKVGCWGYNAMGELGNGTIGGLSTTPVAVTGLTSAVSLGVGYEHGCAVKAGGTVSCWGQNLHGQLGNGGTSNSGSPVAVSSITNARNIAAGNSHTCVALADGTVKCWGYNSQGQLGDGTKVDRTAPVSVPGISTAQAVAAGYYHSCALLANGTVKCWGQGGALGDGTVVPSLTPVTVTGLSGVTSLSAASGNTCAVKSDGTIWCWGGNSAYGTLGNGSTTPQASPVQVTGITTATAAAVGPFHGCAALANGTATCWGFNPYGQLGNATNVDSLAPVAVSSLTNVKSIGVAQYGSCAILTDGSARCWGYNSLGSLGNGTSSHSNIPVTVAAVP